LFAYLSKNSIKVSLLKSLVSLRLKYFIKLFDISLKVFFDKDWLFKKYLAFSFLRHFITISSSKFISNSSFFILELFKLTSTISDFTSSRPKEASISLISIDFPAPLGPVKIFNPLLNSKSTSLKDKQFFIYNLVITFSYPILIFHLKL